MSEEKKDSGKKMPENNSNIKVFRIPGALIFWVLLLIVFGVMFFWKSSGSNPVVQWDQSKFEQRIADVVKAKVIPEGEDMLYIEGEYKLNEAELKKNSAQNIDAKTGKFRTRVLKNNNIDNKLQQINVSIQPKDNWFTSLVSLVLPILIIGIIIYILFSRQIKMANRQATQFGKSRARMILPGDLKVKFADFADTLAKLGDERGLVISAVHEDIFNTMHHI